jgi:two-component system, OmpR family, KDP operon response regulator KdpE
MSARIRALVIDDEAAILRFLKPALEANNYDIASAGTIAEGLKRIAAEAPDIVLLDLGLPDGDGKDIIRRAREWSDLPIIVLSARERETEKIEALDLGADDYVNKPFNVGELLARMRTALRHRMQRKAEVPVLRVSRCRAPSRDARRRRTQAYSERVRAVVLSGEAPWTRRDS